MFDVAPSELLLIAIVAIVVIGPKDMPLALRTAGRWIGKMRRMSNHIRTGFEAMIREAELEEMERKWREQNEAIMKAHPVAPEHAFLPPHAALPPPASADPAGDPPSDAAADPAPQPSAAAESRSAPTPYLP